MLERILELLEEGRSIDEIARELDVPRDEVVGAMEVLADLGYLEQVEAGDSCATCPLKSVCPGACFRFKGKVYQLSDFRLGRKDGH
ncbi:DNA-binding protein [Thermococcus camini]|uniref:LexA-related DNA-binding protein n=1 Tax=Thermococcus camini TaxID=2016373 RepID=A0A7G2DB23_9EURY|nr:DNA-binding protein [Thermococcus camini]CAD5244208.1 LexA-related DNA-binding protein [Thermococcus camini]